LKPENLNPRAVRVSKPYDERDLSAAIEQAFATPVTI
jgi:hypothetical protein